MSSRRKELAQEANRVRSFLGSEAAAASDLFRDFPTGACGNASDILGQWLNERRLPNVEYVHGSRGTKSHGWLECDGLVVDITSDQFPDGLGPVYVGPTSDFHDSFTDQERSVPQVATTLLSLYSRMKREFERCASA